MKYEITNFIIIVIIKTSFKDEVHSKIIRTIAKMWGNFRKHYGKMERTTIVKVAPYSFDCTAHNCIQKTIISSSCKV
jgi:hypothetical protein